MNGLGGRFKYCIDVGLGLLLFGPNLYRQLLVLGCIVIGAATYLFNVAERSRVDFGKLAEDEAKIFVCQNPDPVTDARQAAERLAQSSVSFHAHSTPEAKIAYWMRYIQHLRDNRFWLCP